MCYDNEEWYKIWKGIDLLFQNWHEEFDKFWPEHSKVWKISTLMGSFWRKYIIMFKLKKYRGVMFHDTEEWCKLWRGIELLFLNWHEKFDEFWPEHSKVSKICTLNGLLLTNVHNVWAKEVQKSYLSWHWRVMQNLKKNWLVVWKMTWGIWRILIRALESLKNLHFNGFVLNKVYNVWAKKR